jgi:hypothetical protein
MAILCHSLLPEGRFDLENQRQKQQIPFKISIARRASEVTPVPQAIRPPRCCDGSHF